MEKFEIGEVAIVCGSTTRPETNGLEVTILNSVVMRKYFDGEILPSHWCALPNGERRFAAVRCLRKKRPPSTDEADRIAADLFDRLTLRVPA
jgi:hypothetical protein